jgi:hypothetical protein
MSQPRQWSAWPEKKTDPECGDPHGPMGKRCTLTPGHTGKHCNERYCGTQIVRVWWARGEEKKTA